MSLRLANRPCTEAGDGNQPAPSGDVVRRTRVLHVNSGNMFGGVECILTTLARQASLYPGMESHFALCYEGRLSQELSAAGATIHDMGAVRFSRPWTVWKARRRMRDLLRRERFDLVICHMPWNLAVFGQAVRKSGQKLGLWAHGFHSGRNWQEKLAGRVRPDIIIANSRYTESGLGKLFPNVRRTIIYPPVPLIETRHREEWRASIRRELKAGENTVVIIQVGRFEEWKGHLLHLRALSLMKDIEGWEAWMVGGPQSPSESEYFEQVKRTACETGLAERIKFLGQRSDVPQLLAAADVFCQPNEGPEPFGIVFVEALWAGLPVVSTAMGGAVEVVDESCGFLVKPGSPVALNEVLRRLVESPELRARLGKSGAARATMLSEPAAQMEKLSELARSVGSA